jgi:branched-chain amino acid transport system permease protein
MNMPIHSRTWILLACLGAGVALPFAADTFAQGYYVTVATRVLIYALAATSLNWVLGYGGMVSLGHAAFFGTGAYVVAILMQHSVASAWIAWPMAVAVSALLGFLIGTVCLRTRGVYFIMITLAFAQMLYYLILSLKVYGGDDGLTLSQRSSPSAGAGPLSEIALYFITLAFLCATLYALKRIAASPYGAALTAVRQNPERAESIGFPVYRLRLVCFVMGAALAGLSGALYANLNRFVNPGLLSWTQSGSLLVMVILGGAGHRLGGVIGAVLLILVEELLSSYTLYWQLGLGIFILLMVLKAPRGLAYIFTARSRS